jgi:hypothetical protein
LIVDSSGADKQLIPALSADLIFIPGVGSVVGGEWIQLFSANFFVFKSKSLKHY